MKTKQILLLVALLTGCMTANAQKKWNAELGIGATDNSGNVDNFCLKNNGSVFYEDTTMFFSTKYKFVYQLEDGKESNNGIDGSINYDFYKFGRWSVFVALEMTSNHHKGYDCKLSALTGSKYNFLYKKDTCEYSMSGAIVYDNVNYTDEDTYLNKEVWRISIRPKIYQHFGQNLKLSLVTFYQPSIKNFDDYIINTTFHLENKITQHIYIDLSYNYEYRSEIPSDKYRHYDSLTELTFKIKF